MENEIGGKFREQGAHFLVYRRARGKQAETGITLKSKAFTITGHGGPKCCEMLRHPHFVDQWYSSVFIRVPSDVISLELCTPKAVGV
jgi:hypothetical protein